MSTDLAWLPATAMAAGIAARRFSPVEVIEAVLARLEAVEPRINAFAARFDDQVRAAARAAEAAVMAGEALGPLHGVPITVKDNVAMAGHRLANGSRALMDNVPSADAIIVQRLKAAGAIMLGRTNLPEFAHRILTDTPHFGITRNPWNLDHTPGGSTGGGSAALAAGVGPLAIGTDGGGSIRCPACCVGAVGLKPTLGTIPFESFPDSFGNYAFSGPLARHAADAAVMFAAMAGPADLDPWSIGRAMASGRVAEEGAARGVCIGWLEDFGPYRTDPEVARLTAASVAALAAEGADVEPVAPACFGDVFSYYQVLATAAHATRIGPLEERWGAVMTPALRESIAIGRRWSGVDLLRAQDRRTALFREVQALFRRFDVLATPTMLRPPPTVDAGGSIATDWYAEIAAPLYPFNLTGHPAASVPAGFTAAGLPVGLQLVGPWLGEQRLLDLAALLEARQGFAARRPSL
ncbi:MAG: amidase [Acetobacteraceae bacterium]|nr:amidase [Acetobacteraceae bacterium]